MFLNVKYNCVIQKASQNKLNKGLEISYLGSRKRLEL